MSQHVPKRWAPGRPRCPRSIRRRTDRVRSGSGWAVLLAGLITLVLAAVAGQSAYDDGLARIERDAAARATVVGTLLDDATSARTEPATRARVSYVDPAGRPQIGEITVTGRLPPGTPVRVEVDGDGRVGGGAPLARRCRAVGGRCRIGHRRDRMAAARARLVRHPQGDHRAQREGLGARVAADRAAVERPRSPSQLTPRRRRAGLILLRAPGGTPRPPGATGHPWSGAFSPDATAGSIHMTSQM